MAKMTAYLLPLLLLGFVGQVKSELDFLSLSDDFQPSDDTVNVIDPGLDNSEVNKSLKDLEGRVKSLEDENEKNGKIRQNFERRMKKLEMELAPN